MPVRVVLARQIMILRGGDMLPLSGLESHGRRGSLGSSPGPVASTLCRARCVGHLDNSGGDSTLCPTQDADKGQLAPRGNGEGRQHGDVNSCVLNAPMKSSGHLTLPSHALPSF